MPRAEIKSERERIETNYNDLINGPEGELCLLTTGGLIRLRRRASMMDRSPSDLEN
jgi:hypothetical protein